MSTAFRGVIAAAVVALGMASDQREPVVRGKIQGGVAPSVTAPTPPKVDLGGLPPEAVAGWIAEEVAKLAPELVAHGSDGAPYSVRYHVLPSMLLNEMQKQQRTMETLLARVEELEKRPDAAREEPQR